MSRVALTEAVLLDRAVGEEPDGIARYATAYDVEVVKRGTSEKVAIYDAQVGGSALPNPLRTDEGGMPEWAGDLGWVEEGSYDLLVSGQRIPWEAASGSALDSDLTDLAALAPEDGAVIVREGGKWVALAKGTTGEQLIVRADGTVRYQPAQRFIPEHFGAKGDSNGTAGNGTDDSKPVQEAADAAAELGGELYHESFYRTTKKIEVVTDTFMGDGIGTSKCGIIPDTSEFDALVVGPGAEGSGTRNSGYARNFVIGGGNCNVATAGAAKVTGNAAFKLNGMRGFEVGIRVKGAHDIAFDSVNNCFFTTYLRATVDEGAARVGINWRRGTENGEDQSVIDCAIKGEVAAIHITGGKNYRIIGGQLSASRATASEEDQRGVIILGKDYLGLEGAEIVDVTLQTSFEFFQRCWAIRAFNPVQIKAHSSFNAGASAAALGFYKNSNHANSFIKLDTCSFLSSEFSKPAAEMVVREGSTSESGWQEDGSYGTYKDGTGETNALWNNMARRAEVPRAQGTRAGNIFYFPGMELRVSEGDRLEYSELHKEVWKYLTPEGKTIPAASTISPEVGLALAKISAGSGEIKKITATHDGHLLTLKFAAACKVVNGENLKLGATFEATADDTLTLICDGTNWFKVGSEVN